MDLVIRGGTVVDGSGEPARTADVGIADGRVVEVGRVDGRGAREVDADGLLVTPGFVDIHTHFDGQATWDPELAPSSHHGVTSLVFGNCGVGFAPAKPGDAEHEWLIGLLEGVEDIPGTALTEGLPWDWETFPEYLDSLARRSFAVDLGAQMPHAALRAYVMGERGADPESIATPAEIAEMRLMVEEALDAGALGFTTSRTLVHRTNRGRTIGTYRAPQDEVVGVAEALGAKRAGVIQLISDAYLLGDPEFRDGELALLRELATRTGRPVSFTVQQPDSVPERWRELLDFVGEARREGLDLRGQVAPRPIGVLLGYQASVNPFMFCPSFREVAKRPLPEIAAMLSDPERRTRILAEHPSTTRFLPGFDRWPWDRLFPLGDPPDYEPEPSASVGAAAQRAGVDPLEYVYDLLLEGGGTTLLYCPLMNYASGDLSAVEEMLRSPNVLFGLSDAGAHCRAVSDASFPTTTLAHWGVRRRRGERLPIEALVHGLTRRNALQVGWADRGLLAPGMLADVNVIDLEALDCRPPQIVADLPAGGTRLVQEATGYRMTVKRGVPTFVDGRPTGERPGGLVRGPQSAAA